LTATNEPLRVVLDRILAGTALHVVADGETRLALVRGELRPVVQESGIIQGRVTDAKTGRPLTGARVVLDTASRGVVTDSEGRFRIDVAAGEWQVVVRSVGYARSAKTVAVRAGE